ncbi:MAG: ZIP family metal transporter, partial [Endomicrobia bacterium]|nr:ZIP family metal transporter [Endomicrobiia bacterium]
AAGSLVGASFLHILPEVLKNTDSVFIFYWVVGGFVAFFIFEKYFYWRHCHKGERCEIHPVRYLNLIGDALHNFVDGMFIASSFSINTTMGVISTIAVILHEIPQELGDFSILVYSGLSKIKALFLNLVVSLSAVVGVIIGYLITTKIKNLADFVLAIVAGGFIYIASCDLIPEIQRSKQLSRSGFSLLLFLFGILFMGIIR